MHISKGRRDEHIRSYDRRFDTCFEALKFYNKKLDKGLYSARVIRIAQDGKKTVFAHYDSFPVYNGMQATL
jgi:hypothetical protein